MQDSEGTNGKDSLPKLIYWLDEENRIIRVEGNWDGFAASNGGEDAFVAKILGQRLEGFIKGDTTTMFINALVDAAKILKKKIEKDYRCDSPDAKRYMKMVVEMDQDSTIKITNKTLKIEPVNKKVYFVYQSGQDQKTMERCSICNKIKDSHGEWVEGWDLLEEQRKANAEKSFYIIYVVCETCKKESSVELH